MTALGLPVPPGFTIASDVSVAFARTQRIVDEVRAEVEASLARLETTTGMRLGDPKAPLLVSVRSGARTSMPGMRDTILNLGANDAVAEGLATLTGDRRFALDAHRRFIAMHAPVALGVAKEPFDTALEEARARTAAAKGVDRARLNAEELKRLVPDAAIDAQELEQLVAAFKGIVRKETGCDFPSDPREQLWQAILAVFRSWNNHRAIVYRRMHRIPDSWGTACNVQVMVFGNLGDTARPASHSRVTHRPAIASSTENGCRTRKARRLLPARRTPLPIRSAAHGSGDPDESLETRMPEAYRELERIATSLERHFRDVQDLEFTIQKAKLYMLQCRPAKRTAAAAVRAAVDMVKEGLISKNEAVLRVDAGGFDQLLHPTLDPRAPKSLLARGLPASPGAACGHIVFDADDAERSSIHGKPVILVRIETSPEDIHGVKAARGILTARGGMTSHAAVVTRGMGKPCVAGVSALAVDYEARAMTVTVYDETDTATRRSL